MTAPPLPFLGHLRLPSGQLRGVAGDRLVQGVGGLTGLGLGSGQAGRQFRRGGAEPQTQVAEPTGVHQVAPWASQEGGDGPGDGPVLQAPEQGDGLGQGQGVEQGEVGVLPLGGPARPLNPGAGLGQAGQVGGGARRKGRQARGQQGQGTGRHRHPGQGQGPARHQAVQGGGDAGRRLAGLGLDQQPPDHGQAQAEQGGGQPPGAAVQSASPGLVDAPVQPGQLGGKGLVTPGAVNDGRFGGPLGRLLDQGGGEPGGQLVPVGQGLAAQGGEGGEALVHGPGGGAEGGVAAPGALVRGPGRRYRLQQAGQTRRLSLPFREAGPRFHGQPGRGPLLDPGQGGVGGLGGGLDGLDLAAVAVQGRLGAGLIGLQGDQVRRVVPQGPHLGGDVGLGAGCLGTQGLGLVALAAALGGDPLQGVDPRHGPDRVAVGLGGGDLPLGEVEGLHQLRIAEADQVAQARGDRLDPAHHGLLPGPADAGPVAAQFVQEAGHLIAAAVRGAEVEPDGAARLAPADDLA